MSILPALLMLHLIALVLMAGTTLIEFINYRMFWKLFDHQKEQAANLLSATAGFSRLIGMGGGLLILSGVGMIVVTHGVFAQQWWFKIKMIFVLLLILNNLFNGNRTSMKLRKLISVEPPGYVASILHLKGKLRAFHIAQLCIFLIIIFLSAYKFN